MDFKLITDLGQTHPHSVQHLRFQWQDRRVLAMKAAVNKDKLRVVWKGMLRFSLVSIPVRAYNAKKPSERIELNWLHRTCNNRIHYQKICPIHGEVPDDEIVSAYRYNKRQYIPIEDRELDRFRTKKDYAITVNTFIEPGTIDCMYFTDHTYYLLPDGEAGAKPYLIFHRALQETNRQGIAQVVLFRREQMVLVRPLDQILSITTLSYDEAYRKPDVIEEQLPSAKTSSKELALARDLIESATARDFDYGQYQDPYYEKMMELIETKAKGRKVEPREEEEEPATLNFTEALRKSLARATEKEPTRTAIKQPARRLRQRRVS